MPGTPSIDEHLLFDGICHIKKLTGFEPVSFVHQQINLHDAVGHASSVTYLLLLLLLQLCLDLFGSIFIPCQFIFFLLDQRSRGFVGEVTGEQFFEPFDV